MPRINLLPWREKLRKQRQRAFIQHAGLAFALALGGVILGHVVVQGQIDDQEQRNAFLTQTIADFDQQIAEIKALKETRANLVARMEVIERLQQNRSHVVHAFDEIARTVPEGIILTKVALKDDKLLEINGISDTAARVADYLRNLNRAAWLSDASIVGIGILAQDASNTGSNAALGRKGEYAVCCAAQFAP
ncbi:MAG: PilN domain-containing protein, partial [Gammaproteobacteria bacterium]|nr:PilN domain-containing protein [Gammaproteobacteria bacterium]